MTRALQFLLALLALFSSYVAFVRLAPEPKVRAYQSLVEHNTAEAQHIVFMQPPPSVVLVGSSLAARFQYRTFDACFQNLSLGGESGLTGLALLERSQIHPRTLLIETNVLQRDVDNAFIEDVERPAARALPIFRAENRPVNLAASYVFSLRYPNEPALVRAAETEVDPRVLDLGIALQLKQYREAIDPVIVAARIEQYRVAIARQRAKGARVILVEMPVHASLRQTTRAIQVRSAMRQAFPDLEYWDVATWSGIDPIRTRDGVHLVMNDALRVGDAIRQRLGCAPAAGAQMR